MTNWVNIDFSAVIYLFVVKESIYDFKKNGPFVFIKPAILRQIEAGGGFVAITHPDSYTFFCKRQNRLPWSIPLVYKAQIFLVGTLNDCLNDNTMAL